MQFRPNEDFAHYPRTPQQDARMLAAAGCNLMFHAGGERVYPHGAERATRSSARLVAHPGRRVPPGAFRGVSTVVAKLFHIVEPDVAVFGEKDFQQLTIIRRMVADLCMPVEILAAPDGARCRRPRHELAQQYLTPRERARAPLESTPRCQAAANRVRSGDADFASIRALGLQALESAGFRPDYFAVRQAADLGTPARGARELVVLTAVRMGRGRLIDNVQVSRS